MEIVGYIAAVLIGVTLGLIGSGGSILTVPVLVYLFGVDAVIATSYSLFIVGLTSAVGSFSYLKRKMINGKVVALFGIPSILSVILTRTFIVPAIPAQVNIFNIHIPKEVLMLLLFGLLMIAAAYGMIKNKKVSGTIAETEGINWTLLIGHGFFVGLITGLIGAGGGFLIIPALVMLLKIPIKDAVGNSLVIIAANSFIGFFNSHDHDSINWYLLFTIAALAIIGIFIGIRLSKNMDGTKLKPAFGWFVLIMGIFIILKETIFR